MLRTAGTRRPGSSLWADTIIGENRHGQLRREDFLSGIYELNSNRAICAGDLVSIDVFPAVPPIDVGSGDTQLAGYCE